MTTTVSLTSFIDNNCFTHVTPDPVLTAKIGRLRELEHFAISGNEFTGHIDMLVFPSLKYVDVSNNDFTTAGFHRFHKLYDTLEEMNLSSTLLTQDVSQVFLNITSILKNCNLSNNNIGGTVWLSHDL